MGGHEDRIQKRSVYERRNDTTESLPDDATTQAIVAKTDMPKKETTASALKEPLISVVIPTFNRKHLVHQAIQSIVDQTWPNIEIIVVDDGSTDGTVDAVRALPVQSGQRTRDTQVVYQANAGPASARNHGVSLAKGAYIFFLDSDDTMDPNALEDMVRAMIAADVPLALAPIRSTTLDGTAVGDFGTGTPRFSKEPFKAQWFIHSALYSRSLIDRAGAYSEKLRIGEDSEYHRRIIQLVDKPVQLDHVVGSRRHHDFGHLSLGSSNAQPKTTLIEALLVHEDWLKNNGFSPTAYTTRNYVSFLNTGTRRAAQGEFRDKDQLLALVRRQLSPLHPVTLIYRLHFATGCVGYYRGAASVIDALRFARHCWTARLQRRAG